MADALLESEMVSRPDRTLPRYAEQFAAFHGAFAAELRELVGLLPVTPQMRVLDVCCGDGFYTGLLAERLISPGEVVGLDINPCFLELARQKLARQELRCEVKFQTQSLS